MPVEVFLAGGGALPEGFTTQLAQQFAAIHSVHGFSPHQLLWLEAHPGHIAVIHSATFTPQGEEGPWIVSILNFAMQNNLSVAQCGALMKNPEVFQQIKQLKDKFGLTNAQTQWLCDNPLAAAELYALAAEKNFDESASVALRLYVDLKQAGQIPVVSSSSSYQTIMAQYADELTEGDVPPQWILQWTFAVAVQSGILQYQHPDWSSAKVYFTAAWTVSEQAIHMGLDGIGLVPVIGEFADLTNGFIYYCQGDWQNGTLSVTAAVPFVGWFAQGAKYAQKAVNASGNICTLAWRADAAGYITFGSRHQLRTIIKPAAGYQAHHIIPWEHLNHPVVQAAAKANGTNPWHMNDHLNGLGVVNWRHNGSHQNYNDQIAMRLEQIKNTLGGNSNPDPDAALDALTDLTNDIRQVINTNPNLAINQIIIP